jgi:sulfatase maturation enzyme AslB (radical SAM superfamily)
MGIVFLSGEWDSIIESFRYGKSLKLIWEQFEFSEQEFENLKNLIETLVIEQMLVSIHYDENEEIKEICNDYLIGPTVNLMYLVLTDQCNYGCSYCFVEGVINEDHKFSFMTPQMAKNVLICLLIGAPELSQRINPYFSMGENPC